MTFKFFLQTDSERGRKKRISLYLKPFFCILSFVLLLALSACMTGPPMPKVDLSEPGWATEQGQAVWRRGRNGPEIAGELLAATRADGSAFVQFTKTPIPFAIAQMSAKAWQVEFPPENKRFSAPGSPPSRIVWLQLANALLEKPLANHWTWHKNDAGWRLENASTGESLEGYFSQ